MTQVFDETFDINKQANEIHSITPVTNQRQTDYSKFLSDSFSS
jgi:hypothetical protein